MRHFGVCARPAPLHPWMTCVYSCVYSCVYISVCIFITFTYICLMYVYYLYICMCVTFAHSIPFTKCHNFTRLKLFSYFYCTLLYYYDSIA